jgi:hypothetical protein
MGYLLLYEKSILGHFRIIVIRKIAKINYCYTINRAFLAVKLAVFGRFSITIVIGFLGV